MGLFNIGAPLIADLNLLFQIFIFIFLTVGVSMVKLKRRFKRHGALMGVAIILNSISIVIVMIPSFQSFGGLFEALSISVMVVLIHAVVGVLVETLGVWLVIAWIFRRENIKACANKRKLMRVLVLSWIIELLAGAYVYVMLYVPL